MTTENTFAEAPASATVRMVSPGGYDVMLTLRGMTGAGLLPKVEALLMWATEHGYSPTTAPARASTNTAKGGSDGNGHSESKDADPDVLTDEKGKHYKVCSEHQARMYEKSGKGGETWYSHQLADGSWCKGKAK